MLTLHKVIIFVLTICSIFHVHHLRRWRWKSHRWLNNPHGATGGWTILVERQVTEQSSWSYRWLNNPHGATGGWIILMDYRWLNNPHGATGNCIILLELQVAEQSWWSYMLLNNPHGATGDWTIIGYTYNLLFCLYSSQFSIKCGLILRFNRSITYHIYYHSSFWLVGWL